MWETLPSHFKPQVVHLRIRYQDGGPAVRCFVRHLRVFQFVDDARGVVDRQIGKEHLHVRLLRPEGHRHKTGDGTGEREQDDEALIDREMAEF